MKKFIVAALAALTVGACQADNANLNRQIEQISKDNKAINDKLDTVLAAVKAGGGAAAGAAAARGAERQRPPRPTADPAATYSVDVEGAPSVGPADAKVTIIKAYEYACPYCEKVNPTLDELMAKYGKDLRIVYKQYVVHPQTATAPAVAVCAAHKQGKFIEMDHSIWENIFKTRQFDVMVDDPNGKPMPVPAGAPAGTKPRMPQIQCFLSDAGCPKVEGLAKNLGLDLNKFKADMKACDAEVKAEHAAVAKVGVQATPGFFVNGRFISGAQKTETFSAVIDEELAKANDRIKAGTPQASYYKTWILEKGEKSAPIK